MECFNKTADNFMSIGGRLTIDERIAPSRNRCPKGIKKVIKTKPHPIGLLFYKCCDSDNKCVFCIGSSMAI